MFENSESFFTVALHYLKNSIVANSYWLLDRLICLFKKKKKY